MTSTAREDAAQGAAVKPCTSMLTSNVHYYYDRVKFLLYSLNFFFIVYRVYNKGCEAARCAAGRTCNAMAVQRSVGPQNTAALLVCSNL